MCLLPPHPSEQACPAPCPTSSPAWSNQCGTTYLEPARSLPNEHLKPVCCPSCTWVSSGFVIVPSSPPGSCHQGHSTSWLSLLSVGCHPKSLRATLGSTTLTGNKGGQSPLLTTISRQECSPTRIATGGGSAVFRCPVWMPCRTKDRERWRSRWVWAIFRSN